MIRINTHGKVLLVAGTYIVLWVVSRLTQFPIDNVFWANAISTIIFMSLSILLIFFASQLRWTPFTSFISLAIALLALGVLGQYIREPEIVISALTQIARIWWPMSLGFMIGSALRDKNILLPVIIVLIAVDFWAVFAPSGTVQRGLANAEVRQLFEFVAIQIPKLGSVNPIAQMGPADPLIIGLLFISMHRFNMQSRKTVVYLAPVLILYFWIVLFLGDHSIFGLSLSTLPALVPIGIVFLIVNRKEFQLTHQEILMVSIVLFICCTLLALAFLHSKSSSSSSGLNKLIEFHPIDRFHFSERFHKPHPLL